MRNHSNSNPVNNRSLLRKPGKPGSVEEKMGRIGSVAGGLVDKAVGMPKHFANSAASMATETQANAARKASKLAKDLADRLDPDPAVAEKAMGIGRKLARSASTAVVDAGSKAAGAASKISKDLGTRLDPDQPKTK